MFNFEEAVSKWRDGLKDAGALSVLDVTELEGHLREEAARIEALGLSAGEAFMVASKRIGPPSTLNAEYEKADPTQVWRTRTFWIVLGMFTYWAWTSLISLATAIAFPLARVGYLSGWVTAGVFLVIWGLMMGLIIRMVVLLSRGKLTRLTSAIQKRYRGKNGLLTDVVVLAILLPLARDAWQTLIAQTLAHFADLTNYPSDFYLMSYASLVTTFGAPIAIGVLLHLLRGSRQVSMG